MDSQRQQTLERGSYFPGDWVHTDHLRQCVAIVGSERSAINEPIECLSIIELRTAKNRPSSHQAGCCG